MRFFFLLGCHRSGTTMLQQALNRHAHIVIPPETKYFSSFLGTSEKDQRQCLRRINRDLQLSIGMPVGRICQDKESGSLFSEIATNYVDRLGRKPVAWFGEKTPAHSGYVPVIRRLFPEARFIWIYRDGRDVAASLRKVPWMSRSLEVNFLVWLFYYRKQREAASDKRLKILFLKYEEVVADPTTQLKRATDFLDLDFDPDVALGSGNRQGVLEWEYPWKAKALEPISRDRVGAWMKELSPQEIHLLEWLGSRRLRRLGYPLIGSGPIALHYLSCPKLALDAMAYLMRKPLVELANQFLRPVISRG